MPKADTDEAARQAAAELTKEWTPTLADVGVAFHLRPARHPTLRGGEQGLELHVWPQSGFDNYFEVWRVRSWAGRRRNMAPLPEVAVKLRRTLARYAENPG